MSENDKSNIASIEEQFSKFIKDINALSLAEIDNIKNNLKNLLAALTTKEHVEATLNKLQAIDPQTVKNAESLNLLNNCIETLMRKLLLSSLTSTSNNLPNKLHSYAGLGFNNGPNSSAPAPELQEQPKQYMQITQDILPNKDKGKQ
jgi:hypothetical protein